jgi:hypothetical protein
MYWQKSSTAFAAIPRSLKTSKIGLVLHQRKIGLHHTHELIQSIIAVVDLAPDSLSQVKEAFISARLL